jgi:protoglobin
MPAGTAPTQASIPGYDYGSRSLPQSPVSLEELRALEQAAGITDEDQQWLRAAGKILAPNAERIVDSWRARIAAQPELAQVFFGPDGQPDDAYKAAVKKRFVQWVLDACERPYDQAWLDYQEEIGKRHTPARKNQTEHAQTPPVVPLRFLIAFTAITATTIRPFLEESGQSQEDLQKMQDAWTKSMLLHLALWSRPYIAECLW